MKNVWYIIIILWSINAYAIDWKKNEHGIEYTSFEIDSKYNKNQITLNLFKINSNDFRVEVADVYSAAQKINSKEYSLKTVMDAYNPIMAINGGYTKSFTNPIPAGIVKIKNKLYARFYKHKDDVQSGVVCIKGKTVNLIKREEYKDENCESSLQAGPRLIEDHGKIGINESEINKEANRSLICIINPNEILFAQTSKASLYELAELFGANRKRKIVKCNSVLNLDGAESSGVIIKNNNKNQEYGTPTSLIPSSIYIIKRRT